MRIRNILAIAAMAGVFGVQNAAGTTIDTIGNVRVSCLSPILVRVEAKNTAGNFEDRVTLMVVERNWPAVQRTKTTVGTTVTITTANYTVQVGGNGGSINGTLVQHNGQTIFNYGGAPCCNTWGQMRATTFPAPDELGDAYIVADDPRVAPPVWGGLPMPAGAIPATDPLYATKGWDFRYTATGDAYVFVNAKQNYNQDYVNVRKDFLKLTGPIPLTPRWYLGLLNSRYQAITQSYAIAKVDSFRNKGIPLDMFICDIDWRQNDLSYSFNSTLFPNPTQFFTDLHNRHVKVGFNDHPVGAGDDYQRWWDSWTSRMNDGLDFWWYDRNWYPSSGTMMHAPAGASVDQETWGMRLYWDVQKKFLEDKTGKKMRPTVIGMVSGDPNNPSTTPALHPHPGFHRYPSWWTGDYNSTNALLDSSVAISVADGVRLLPNVVSNIAGFQGNNPGDDLYTRWMVFGCFSPLPWIHGRNAGEGILKRYPWEFSDDTRVIVTKYISLRYRLVPMMYSAFRKCFEDGTPLLQRCDLQWPAATYPQAKSNYQYLFGDDILIRPATAAGGTMTAGIPVSTWIPPGDWFDAWTGEVQAGPKTINVDSKIWHEPMFIRKGAIITLCPDMQYTSEKPWDPVTLEVFPPAVDSTVTRTLYEDDFETFNYEQGEYAKTGISAARTAGGIRLSINAAQGGSYTGKLATRAWIVRLHLDAPHASQQVQVNGVTVTIGTAWTKGATPQARRLDPATFPSPVTSANMPIPLQGEGQAAAAQAAGPVIEVWVPPAATSLTQNVAYGSTVGIQQPEGAGFQNRLENYPNPFNPQTTITYIVHRTSNIVKMRIYSTAGKLVATLVNQPMAAGIHTVRWNAAGMASGLYVVKLEASGKVLQKTMLLMK